MLEDDVTVTCPYCSQSMQIRVDHLAGRRQRFVYDCEVCCQPMAVDLETDGREVLRIEVEPES